MKLLQKLLFCLFCAAFSLCGNELINISRELDYFERAFLKAAGSPKNAENHLEMEKRLVNFHYRMVQLQRRLQKQRIPKIPNFVHYSMGLKRIFDNFGVLNKKKGRIPNLKGTGMGEYTRVFLRNLRYQTRDKKKPRPRSATIKNVDIGAYSSWLNEIAQSNIDLIQRRKNIKGSTQRSIETYVYHIVALRKCVVMLAQNKHYKP